MAQQSLSSYSVPSPRAHKIRSEEVECKHRTSAKEEPSTKSHDHTSYSTPRNEFISNYITLPLANR